MVGEAEEKRRHVLAAHLHGGCRAAIDARGALADDKEKVLQLLCVTDATVNRFSKHILNTI